MKSFIFDGIIQKEAWLLEQIQTVGGERRVRI